MSTVILMEVSHRWLKKGQFLLCGNSITGELLTGCACCLGDPGDPEEGLALPGLHGVRRVRGAGRRGAPPAVR